MQQNSNEKTSVTMSTSGAESVHLENKNPNDGGCQTMEIENVRKEKKIKRRFNSARRALLVGLTKEQKNPEGGKKKIGCRCLQVYMEILLRIGELYSKENDMKNLKK